MTDLELARERVVAAALLYAGGRIGRESLRAMPNDDADAELESEALHACIGAYREVFEDELQGIENGG